MAQNVDVKEISAKMSKKWEVGRFLKYDVGAYLCHDKYFTMYHYRDLCNGKKKVGFQNSDFNIFVKDLNQH